MRKCKGLRSSGILTWHFSAILFVKLTYRVLIVLSYWLGSSEVGMAYSFSSYEACLDECANLSTGSVFQCCSWNWKTCNLASLIISIFCVIVEKNEREGGSTEHYHANASTFVANTRSLLQGINVLHVSTNALNYQLVVFFNVARETEQRVISLP